MGLGRTSWAALLAASLCWFAAPASAAPGDVSLLSAGAEGAAQSPSLSADGAAAAYVAEDADARSVLRLGATSILGGADPSLSASGRYVAFQSTEEFGDGGSVTRDVYRRDTLTGATTLVSRADGPGGAAGDDDSGAPAITADGRHVAFRSEGDNLSDADDDAVANVFLRDVSAGTTLLVSRGDGSAPGADGPSIEPAVAGAGSLVAFRSFATGLAPGVDGSAVYLRDTARGTTTLVSRADGPAGGALPGDATDPAVAAGGRFVAFATSGPGTGQVWVRDTLTGTTTLVSRAPGAGGAPADRDAAEPAISADGRRVAFTSAAELGVGGGPGTDVFVRDLDAESLTLASGGPSPEEARQPALSGDGRFVGFVSDDVLAAGGRPEGSVYRRELAPRGPASGQGGTPPAAGVGADRTGPGLSIAATRRQRLGQTIRVRVRCLREPCRLTLAARVSTRRGQRARRPLRARRVSLARNRRAVVRVRIAARTRRVLGRALARRARVAVAITATASDRAGNRTIRRATVALRIG